MSIIVDSSEDESLAPKTALGSLFPTTSVGGRPPLTREAQRTLSGTSSSAHPQVASLSLRSLFAEPQTSSPFRAVPLETEALDLDLVSYVQMQVAKGIFIDPTKPRPALLWHGTGTGKTRAALLIALHIPVSSSTFPRLDSKAEFSKVDFVTRKAVAEQQHFEKELVRLVSCEWYEKYHPDMVHFLKSLAIFHLRKNRETEDSLKAKLSNVRQTGVVTGDLARAFWPPSWRVFGHDAFMRVMREVVSRKKSLGETSSSSRGDGDQKRRRTSPKEEPSKELMLDMSPEAQLQMALLDSLRFTPHNEPSSSLVHKTQHKTSQVPISQTSQVTAPQTPRYIILDEAQLCASTYDNHSKKEFRRKLLDFLRHPQSNVSLLAALSATPAPNLRETAWGLLSLLWDQSEARKASEGSKEAPLGTRRRETSETNKEQTPLQLLYSALRDVDGILQPDAVCKNGDVRSYVERAVAAALQEETVRVFVKAFKCQISWFPKTLLPQTRMEEHWIFCPCDPSVDGAFQDMYDTYEQMSFPLALEGEGRTTTRPKKRSSADQKLDDEDNNDGSAFFVDLRQAANTYCEVSPLRQKRAFSSSHHPSGPKLRYLSQFIYEKAEEIVRDQNPLRIVIYSNFKARGVNAVYRFLRVDLLRRASEISTKEGNVAKAEALRDVESRLHMFAGGADPAVIEKFNCSDETTSAAEEAALEVAVDAAVDAFNRHRKGGIMLLSSRGGEGIEIKDVDVLFLLESQWHMEKTEQILGRVVRYGSHQQGRGDKPVRVYHLLLQKNFATETHPQNLRQIKEVETDVRGGGRTEAESDLPRVEHQSPVVVCQDGKTKMGFSIDAMLTQLADVKIRRTLSLHLLLVLCTLQYNMESCFDNGVYDLSNSANVQREVTRCLLEHMVQVCARSAKVGKTMEKLRRDLQQQVQPSPYIEVIHV